MKLERGGLLTIKTFRCSWEHEAGFSSASLGGTVPGPAIPPVSLPAVWAWKGFSGAQQACLCFCNRSNFGTWRERWTKNTRKTRVPIYPRLSSQKCSCCAFSAREDRCFPLCHQKQGIKWGISPLWWIWGSWISGINLSPIWKKSTGLIARGTQLKCDFEKNKNKTTWYFNRRENGLGVLKISFRKKT